MAEASGSSEKKKVTKERGIDDYKRKIWKLKKELEEQRELSLTIQKEELAKLAQVSTGWELPYTDENNINEFFKLFIFVSQLLRNTISPKATAPMFGAWQLLS